MKFKLLITIEGGKLRVCANGNAQVFVEHMDNLNGVEQIEVSEITIAEFDALLRGKEPEVIL